MPALKPMLCQIDDQGRLILPEEMVRELQSKGLRTAILFGGTDGHRLEFYPDEVTAKAVMLAREDMQEHHEVYEGLAKR